MAIYRNVQLAFWTDSKVEDDFTPEDKYFYMYLLTNPQTNICGCYEVNFLQMARHTGYSKDTIVRLLERFDKVHGVIKYDSNTKEILILRWYKYNWNKSEKVLAGVLSAAKRIKSEKFRKYVNDIIDSIRSDTPLLGHSIEETSDTNLPDNANEKENNAVYMNVIDYLNKRCNTKYRYNTQATKRHIHARIEDGYKESDFYEVIDKKAGEWLGTDMEKYLRPETLFGTKFENYLNQNIAPNKNFSKGAIDWDNV
jgi:uncharacterized phage protein (TIGR02220 family)